MPLPFINDMVTACAATLLLDGDCTGASVTEALKAILKNPGRPQQMTTATASLARPGTAEAIVEEILLLAFELRT